jgi:MFS transporter, DHA1 family, multidrug resistance protein
MAPTKPLRQGEFVALMAALFATIAISIDAMLPALPEIAATLTPDAPNRAQLVVTSFVFGMGLGTLFAGPLADAFGRKAVILAGALVYVVAAIVCYFSQSLEMLLIARVVQGIGAAAPRVVSTAMIRDLFHGRDMARVMSLVMTVFTLVPAIAPLMGQGVMAVADWHAIFLVYVAFAAAIILWMGLRQPETLPPEARRPLSIAALWKATKELFSHRIVILSILAQTVTLGALFSLLSSQQGIFEQRFDRAETFPLWFGIIAIASASGSIFNARMVMQLGMRRVLVGAYTGVVTITIILLALIWTGLLPEALAFPAHVGWSIVIFAMMGLSMGNLNALAMEPVGHIAGLAASVIASISTVLSVLIAIPVGLAFDGTVVPLMAGVAVFISLALIIVRQSTK